MPQQLHRYYGAGYLHFITTSCYQRWPLLDSRCTRDLFLEALEDTRRGYGFVVAGYVVMPEHVHLLLGECERASPSVVMQVLKQTFARRWLRRLCAVPRASQEGGLWNYAVEEGHVWQRRFYDFVVWTDHKRVEKLRYIHRNPVQRGLVTTPEEWRWSSFRYYAYGEAGPVFVDEKQKAEMRITRVVAS